MDRTFLGLVVGGGLTEFDARRVEGDPVVLRARDEQHVTEELQSYADTQHRVQQVPNVKLHLCAIIAMLTLALAQKVHVGLAQV